MGEGVGGRYGWLRTMFSRLSSRLTVAHAAILRGTKVELSSRQATCTMLVHLVDRLIHREVL